MRLELGFVVLMAGSLLGVASGSDNASVPAAGGFVALAGVALVGLGLALRLDALLPGRALSVVFEGLMCVAALCLVAWGALVMDNRAPLHTALALVLPLADGVLVWLALRLVRQSRSESGVYVVTACALACLLASTRCSASVASARTRCPPRSCGTSGSSACASVPRSPSRPR